MAPAVPKERGKPGQLSDLPENSPRHTARFTVPRNDKKMKLCGGQRTGDRPFQPTARFFQAGGPPCRRLWPCSRGQAHPAVPSLKKKPVRHRLGKAALSQICAFFAESTVCLCSPQRRALGGWGGGGRGEPGSGASPHGTPAASARAPAPRGPPRARTRGTTVSPRRPGHGGLAAWGPPPPGPVRRGVVRVRAGPVRPHLRSGSWPGPAGGAPGWRRRRRSAPPPGSPAARGGAGTARAAAPRPPPPRRTRAPGRSSPVAAAAARGRAGQQPPSLARRRLTASRGGAASRENCPPGASGHVCMRGGEGGAFPGGPEAAACAEGARMRVKVLSRNPDDYLRETKLDLQRGERGSRGGAGSAPLRRPGRTEGSGGGGEGEREGAQASAGPAAELPPGEGASPLRAAQPPAGGGLPAAGLGGTGGNARRAHAPGRPGPASPARRAAGPWPAVRRRRRCGPRPPRSTLAAPPRLLERGRWGCQSVAWKRR